MKRLSVVALVLLSACSLQPGRDHSRVTVELRNRVEPLAWFQDPERVLRNFFLTPNHQYCVGLNVMGSGIPIGSRFGSGYAGLSEILQGSTCSYEGAFSGWQRVEPGTTSVELSVNVPTGPDRIVQVAGTGDFPAVDCPTAGTDPQVGLPVYELGRAITGIFGATTVAVNAHPQASALRMNCTSPVSFPANPIAWYRAEDVSLCAPAGSSASSWPQHVGIFGVMSSGAAVTCDGDSGPNGRPEMIFTLSPPSQRFAFNLSNAELINISGLTAFVVGKTNAISGSFVELSYLTDTYYLILKPTGSGETLAFAAKPLAPPAGIQSVPLSGGLGNSRIYSGRWNSTGYIKVRADTTSQLDESPDGYFADTVGLFNTTSHPVDFRIGGNNSSNHVGGISEVIVYNRALSDAEMAVVIAMLETKYAL